MSRERSTPSELTGIDDGRRRQILQAAYECFDQLGIARTSLHDVARVAQVSRGTVYRYFSDREELIDAAVELGVRQFYADAAASMAAADTLARQVGAMAEVLAGLQNDHRTRTRLLADDTPLIRQMIDDSDAALRRMANFLEPYVTEAQVRGEVRGHIDVAAASEWLARCVSSLRLADGLTFDLHKPRAAREFIETFAVAGLK